jgi:uncharacterized SAM-binding protein YcdF (DUF218 family)
MRSLISYGFLAPPIFFISSSLVGVLLMSLWRGIVFVIVLSSNICLFVAATPAFSSYLTHQLEAKIPPGPDLRNAQAVVVLGADFQSAERAAMSDRLGPLSLERLVFASAAYHQLHLPVAVSGGRVGNMQSSLAELMKTTLETYLKIPVTWIEDQSLTTYENALYTERLLRDQHVHTIVLIAQTRDLVSMR